MHVWRIESHFPIDCNEKYLTILLIHFLNITDIFALFLPSTLRLLEITFTFNAILIKVLLKIFGSSDYCDLPLVGVPVVRGLLKMVDSSVGEG